MILILVVGSVFGITYGTGCEFQLFRSSPTSSNDFDISILTMSILLMIFAIASIRVCECTSD